VNGVIFKEEPMKRPRITLAGLMIVIAVVAVDLAAFILDDRSLGGDWVRGLPPTALACQIGLLCAVLSRGLSRAFWTGFVVFGCAMMATFAWGLCFPLQESAVNDAWRSYGEFASDVYWGSPYEEEDVAMAVIWTLPQLAAACVGGVFVLLVTLVMRPFFRVRATSVRKRDEHHSRPRVSRWAARRRPIESGESIDFGRTDTPIPHPTGCDRDVIPFDRRAAGIW
jgi:hypothetical protein